MATAQSVDRETLRWMRDRPVIDSIEIYIDNYFGTKPEFSEGDIKSQMYSKVRGLFEMLRGDRRSRLQRETLDRDTLEIKYLYLTNGYLGVQVLEEFKVIEPDSSALISVRIAEGRQFTYGEKTLTGNFSPAFNDHFRNIYKKLKTGDPVNLLALQQATFDMKTVLANRGFPYARISFEYDTLSGPPVTPVTFIIEADSLVHFGEVEVEGADKYPESVARRELTFKPGDLYRRRDIVNSQRRLFESGYFSYLQLDRVQESGDRLNPDFLLRVRERRPRFVSVKTGAGQSELKDLIWDFSLGGGKRNFLGSRRVSLTSDYSF
jgi:outer membrane protein insertion porin family